MPRKLPTSNGRARRVRRARAACILALSLLGLAATEPTAAAAEPLKIDLGTALQARGRAQSRRRDLLRARRGRVGAAGRSTPARRADDPRRQRIRSAPRHHPGNERPAIDDVDRASRSPAPAPTLGVDIANAMLRRSPHGRSLDAVRARRRRNRHRVLVDVASALPTAAPGAAEARVVDAALERANDLAELTANYARDGRRLARRRRRWPPLQPLLWQQRQLVARENVESAAAAVVRPAASRPRRSHRTDRGDHPAARAVRDGDDLERLIDRAARRTTRSATNSTRCSPPRRTS